MAHKGQMRKDGEDYINHPRRVAARQPTLRGKIAAWLHDVIEDTHITMDILDKLGFPLGTLMDVDMLTRHGDETYWTYIEGLMNYGSDHALKVKLSDLEDNLMRRYAGDDGLRTRYQLTQAKIENELAMRRIETASNPDPLSTGWKWPG